MNGDGSVKLAILENPARLSPLDRAAKQGTRGAIDLLHKVLTQLLEDPDSSEPFDLLLSHILELSGAEAGAIFVSTDSGRQSVLLACNGPDDRERWMRVVRERDLYLGTDGRVGSEILEDLEDPGSTRSSPAASARIPGRKMIEGCGGPGRTICEPATSNNVFRRLAKCR
jgi:hypothetical protein